MSLEIINNPILATIQDKGRYSYSHIGVTNSGVMDEYAYMYANKMLSNPLNTNTIEISFSNVSFKAHADTQIAITGAICEVFINDISKICWHTYHIKSGDIIKIGKILEGSRVYFSVKDGFDIKKEFGSNSTTLKENLGGLDGGKLKKGDILAFKPFPKTHNKRLKKEHIPIYEDELILRVILSYQEENFSKEEQDKFFSNTYTITNEFNRMGCKLSGKAIACDINGIISEGISFGAIQIPSDGQPIILLKDRQTIGGYPKIGSVFSIDCFKLSQAKPNCKIKFVPIGIEEAQEKLRAFYHYFR
ncbi:MAG: biotin-dependent carboxyltransferase family protein [Arcobacter sp.]|uniref:5-oxoprolinase subunit C family protein n=1 Tax=Arcobacter sp. TaxID=1872629 RepID=UPI003AFF97E7